MSPFQSSLGIDQIVPIPIRRAGCVGDFISFTGLPENEEHFAVRLGAPDPNAALVRIHSECITGDVFGSERCDCGAQLSEALDLLAREGGYLLYLRQEGRGIGLAAKLRAYALQDRGRNTYEANVELGHPADARDFGVAAAMLRALGVGGVTLLTNNPQKARALRDAHLDVTIRPTAVHATPHNRAYLHSKRDEAGHWLDLAEDDARPPARAPSP